MNPIALADLMERGIVLLPKRLYTMRRELAFEAGSPARLTHWPPRNAATSFSLASTLSRCSREKPVPAAKDAKDVKPRKKPKEKQETPAPDWLVKWEDSSASETFAKFSNRNKYSRGDAELSVTQLISPPRIVALEKIHADNLVKEESSSIQSIIGSAVHKILEEGAPANFITERRFFTVIDGVKVSGAMDVIAKIYDEGVIDIEDYKVTSMWSLWDSTSRTGTYPSSWVKQLNSYAALVRRVHGKKVRYLRVHAVLRDYSKARAPSWMDRPVVTIEIPMWDEAGQDAYLEQQVARHKKAQADVLAGEDLPACSPEDTWDSEAARAFYYQSMGDYYMDDPKRCANFCAVAPYCDQYQAFKVGFTLEDHLARTSNANPQAAGADPVAAGDVL